MSNDDPHRHISCASHCCLYHGCKYDYEDCPVEMKLVDQEYPCEYCQSPSEIDGQMLELSQEMRRMTELYTRLGRMGE